MHQLADIGAGEQWQKRNRNEGDSYQEEDNAKIDPTLGKRQMQVEWIGVYQKRLWADNHNGQTQQERQNILDHTDKIGRDRSLYSRHIIGEAAEEFPGPMVLEEAQGEVLQVAVKLNTQIDDDPFPKRVHPEPLSEREEGLDGGQSQHRDDKGM